MKCVEIEKLLDQFAGGELDFAMQRRVDSHLHECEGCRSEAENLQNTARLLKSIPLIAPSNRLDTRMMQAFRKHQETQNQPGFWTTFFGRFSISKSALACAALILIAFTALAFQLGRISAPNDEVVGIKNVESAAPVMQIVEKRIEVPVIKTVEVPVYKEKIVTRVVYRDRLPLPKPEFAKARQSSNIDSLNNTATFIQTSGESFAPLNLENFQPTSEIKISVIKRGENEK